MTEIEPIQFSQRLKALVPEDHLYTWSIAPNSFLYKYYRWVFGQEACKNITFCKLWWSVIFAPLMIAISVRHHVHIPERPPSAKDLKFKEHQKSHVQDIGSNRYPNWTWRRGPIEDCSFCDKKIRRDRNAKRARQRSARIAAWGSRTGDRIVTFFQSKPLRLLGKVLQYLSVGILALGVTVGFSYLMWLWSTNAFQGLMIIGITVGVGLAVLLSSVLLIFLFEFFFKDPIDYETPHLEHDTRAWYVWDEWLYRWLYRSLSRGAYYTVAKPARHGGSFFMAGYHMIKYRTCPKVKVEELDTLVVDRTLERVRKQVVSDYINQP